MCKWLALLGLFLCDGVASAQPIHGHPQKTAYASPAEWPTDSFQCHWSAVGANFTGDRVDLMGFNPKGTVLDPAHVHIDLHFPRDAELGASVRVDFKITLRQCAGTFGIWGAGPQHAQTPVDAATDWWWDDTQSSKPPVMKGDPVKADAMGVQTFTGHFTFHPRSSFHGWDAMVMAGQATFANGDLMQVAAFDAYWDSLDPTAPITPTSQGTEKHPFMGTICSPIAANAPGDSFGDVQMMVDDFLPLLPISGPWVTTTEDPALVQFGSPAAQTNAYGGTSLLNTPGSYQTRHDQNFHMGIPGVIVSEVDKPGIIGANVGIDNTGLPVGPHPWALIRFQPENSIPTNGVASLLVIQVPVPDGTVVTDPPPPPQPPPVDTGTPVPLTARVFANGLLRVCVPDGRCVELAVK